MAISDMPPKFTLMLKAYEMSFVHSINVSKPIVSKLCTKYTFYVKMSYGETTLQQQPVRHARKRFLLIPLILYSLSLIIGLCGLINDVGGNSLSFMFKYFYCALIDDLDLPAPRAELASEWASFRWGKS